MFTFFWSSNDGGTQTLMSSPRDSIQNMTSFAAEVGQILGDGLILSWSESSFTSSSTAIHQLGHPKMVKGKSNLNPDHSVIHWQPQPFLLLCLTQVPIYQFSLSQNILVIHSKEVLYHNVPHLKLTA